MERSSDYSKSVFLADDHVLIREALKSMLQQAGFTVVGEASDGRAAAEMCDKLGPEIAVLDIAMPVMNGIDATREILRRRPGASVILLSMYYEDGYVLAALRAGVKGYVLKQNAASTLLQAIEAVTRGEVYLSPRISQAVVKAYLSSAEGPADPLSSREREVLQLIAEGRTLKEAADVLGISIRTAETHRIRLAQKLGLRDVASLTRYAIRRGLIRADGDVPTAPAEGRERDFPSPPQPPSLLRAVAQGK